MDAKSLSAEKPVANIAQRDMEDRAMGLLQRPEVQKAKQKASYLWREVAQYPAAEQMSQFDGVIDEYVFHHALIANASDADHPGVLRFMTPAGHWFGRDIPGSRWAGDSPDFIYRMIPVGHGGRYEIRGWPSCAKFPTAHYALMSDSTAAPAVLGLLDSLDLKTEVDGSFVITVDADPADGRSNHMQTQPGSRQIWVRDALGDWMTQSPNALTVTRLNAPARGPLTDDELAQKAALGISEGIYYTYYIGRTISAQAPNIISPPVSSAAFGGMATQYTCRGYLVLAEDEAMIITASSAGALFRNVVLHNLFSLSLDYWNRTGSLNSTQMAPDENGLFTYVVAHEDPGVHNWLDTGGVRQIIMGHRWQSFPGGEATEAPTITSRIVKLRDLPDALPPGVKSIDAAGRREQLAQRKAGFARRFVDS